MSAVAPAIRLALGLAVLLALLPATRQARAAVIPVTTLVDEFADPGPGTGCSLREAIRAANTDAPFGGCPAGSGSDLITVPAGTYRFVIPGRNEDATATGDLDITSALEIRGAGAGATTIEAARLDRAFHVLGAAGDATIRGLLVRGGDPGGGFTQGGGLLVAGGGRLRLEGAMVEDNRALLGGGINNDQSTTLLERVTVRGNQASSGGGVSNIDFQADLTIRASTISGNTAIGGIDGGGGVHSTLGRVLLENVTISGNTAGGRGGGGIQSISGSAVATLVNVTLADNRIVAGNGANLQAGLLSTAVLRDTLLADPVGGDNCSTVFGQFGPGVITSLGSNLSDDQSCAPFFGQPGDRNEVDPRLGSLRDNGGPTQTHAPAPDSPAVDGVAACDIGAFEVAAAPPGPPSQAPGGAAPAPPPPAAESDPEPRKLTEEQRQQRRRTDTSSLDDTRTEGHVLGTRCQVADAVPTLSQGFIAQPDAVPYVLIGMRDGLQQVLLLYDTASQCRSIQAGDYLQADGEKVHEQLFEAHHATITRGGRRVR